jgi:peptidylprolyl isomerase
MKKTVALLIVLGLVSCGKKEEAAQQTPAPEPTPAAAPAPPPPPAEPIKSGDTTINPSGLKFIDVKEGKGASPKAGQMVSMMYTGKLVDGTAFDSNQDPKFGHPEPLKFAIGTGQVISGWDEGIMSMKVGGKRKLIIPPNLAYGSQPPPGSNIPVDAWLIFDVELIGIQ